MHPGGGSGPSRYITLVSSDGFEFVVLRQAAFISPAIKKMLDPKSQFSEARTGRCHFEEINGMVLEKVAEYFHYWYKNRDREDVPDLDIPVELCLELLVAADYLGLDSKTDPQRLQRA
ncbi:hypothetical protein DL766_002170 [Monosporascus sp. MC13-8B]|uniref:Elongin-C n=1 Tax=Monosporascus cannonballus TaxID=155416 RepID=A0ABY0HLE9_9PEZI|nr:hypothetical protein DL763_004989 [Monosporascus cannonballus]RYO93231.1 hypothetical protein DL762_001180 [Monosporascus cannonballus]RYP36121.1 hypothetical protein DL766_002170 [Monosporascus sp. MC13-8B]